jgi:hypothetical protein
VFPSKKVVFFFYFTIFFVNTIVLAIPIQNEEFLESNELAAELLRGLGWIGNDVKSSVLVSPLSKGHSSSLKPETNIRAGIQSQYSVPGWIDTRWQFRHNITILSSQIPSDLTDYPFLFDIISTDLYNNVQVDGGDIFFTNSTGDRLDHEIEKIDWHYTSTQVHLVTWVRIPFLSSTADTKISMYYGNPTSPNQENPEGVWDSGYAGVWHMKEDPSDSSPQIKDSTLNGIDGTSGGSMTSSDLVEGQIDGSLDFDGLDDTINVGTDSSLKLTSAFTIEGLYNGMTDISPNDRAPIYTNGFSWSNNIGIRVEGFHDSTDKRARITYGNGTYMSYILSDNDISENTWTHLVTTYDGTTLKLFINGEKQADEEIGTIAYNIESATIGGSFDNSEHRFNGSLDEIRVSGVARSVGWAKTNYENIFNPGSFYSISPKETTPISIDWAQPLFRYRKNITIDAGQVAASLVDFPILVNHSDSDLYDTDKVQADGDDILFTDSSGIKLDHEIELFDQSGNGTHAQLVAWVRVPSLSSSTDTNITMYYGNNAVKNQENPEGVWNTDYKGVWHMKENPSIGTIYDSTSYDHDGTPRGSMTSDDQVDGIIDGCLEFDGINDDILMGDPSTLDMGTSDFTIEAWIKLSTSPTTELPTIMSKGGVANNIPGYWLFWYDSNNNIRLTLGDGVTRTGVASISSIRDNSWHHVVAVADRDGNGEIYIDGGLDNSADISSLNGESIDTSINFYISNSQSGSSSEMDGPLDEIRISSVARSGSWIATEYKNQNDTNSFYSVSPEEEYSKWWADASFTKRKDIVIDKDKVGNFKYKKIITIDSAKVSGSGGLTNFPVLINLSDTDLHDTNKVQADGDDIIFTDTSGTKLDHELELFNQTYNSTHAELVAWVRIPSLSATSDTDLIMHYGNNNIGSQENPEGVWDNNYKGVWHLNEDPSDGAPQMKDSSSNGYHGTSAGSMTSGDQVTGQIGGSLDFDGTDDNINCGAENLNIVNEVTLETWIQLSTSVISSPNRRIFGINNEYVIHQDWDNPGMILFLTRTSGGDSWGSYASNIPIDTWVHIVGVFNGTTASIYVDGSVVRSWSISGTIDQTTNSLLFSDGNIFDGLVDEARVSNIARSDDWIMTSYNNQYNPYSFISVGSEKTADLTDFPVLIDITLSELRTGIFQPDADDLIFTTANGSKLDHEIDYFDQQSANGHLVAWVRLPTLSAAEDTVLSMYYGNTELEAQENPEKVWDPNYVAVWHLSEDPTTTVIDSTANSNDGNDNNSMASNDLISSKIGLGLDFDHVDDHIIVPYSDNLGIVGNKLSLEAWVYLPTVPLVDDAPIIELGNGTNKERYMLGIDGGVDPAKLNQRVTTVDGHFRYDNGTINQGSWTYISMVYDGSLVTTPRLFGYINGELIASNNASGNIVPIASSYNLSIGKRSNGRLYEGRMDELRISNNSRSSDYIATSYNNQENPSTFYSLGTEVVFDADPPVIENFGIDDPGTGIGKFWAIVADSSSDVSSVKITINNTEYSMNNNNTHWIYQHSSVEWLKTYEYLITNASDTFGNNIDTNSSTEYYTFEFDNQIPAVQDWEYIQDIGPYGTFKANVTDSWGVVDTVIINVTEGTILSGESWAVMALTASGYVNNTIEMNSGSIKFVIIVNDSAGNSFTSSEHQGYVPIINHAPEASNLTLSRDQSSILKPIYSNSTLYLNYTYSDVDGDPEAGTKVRWYKNGILQAGYDDQQQIPASALLKGDEWNVTVEPKDNEDFGIIQASETVTIQNTPPTLTTIPKYKEID